MQLNLGQFSFKHLKVAGQFCLATSVAEVVFVEDVGVVETSELEIVFNWSVIVTSDTEVKVTGVSVWV